MKGLALSRYYFEKYAERPLRQRFPDLFDRMAIGLAGLGSECFGFDDEISKDHDWGPSFCIWLTNEDFLRYGRDVRSVYETLPRQIEGYGPRFESEQGSGRVGVLCTQIWYQNYTGFAKGPQTLDQWRRIPESYLAAATNGEVFWDPYGEFTETRNYLLAFYPEDVRLKKIAARCAQMAQAGQYNYPRCVKRGDAVAAQLALDEFLRGGMSIVYLLNKKYAPFYKWTYRGMRDLPLLPRTYELFGRLVQQEGDSFGQQARKRQDLIERICALVEGEMQRQGMSSGVGMFMQDHCASVLDKIEDRQLRESHVMADV